MTLVERLTLFIQQIGTDVKSLKDLNTSTGIGMFKFWTGTQAEYDALPEKDENTLYFVK